MIYFEVSQIQTLDPIRWYACIENTGEYTHTDVTGLLQKYCQDLRKCGEVRDLIMNLQFEIIKVRFTMFVLYNNDNMNDIYYYFTAILA